MKREREERFISEGVSSLIKQHYQLMMATDPNEPLNMLLITEQKEPLNMILITEQKEPLNMLLMTEQKALDKNEETEMREIDWQ